MTVLPMLRDWCRILRETPFTPKAAMRRDAKSAMNVAMARYDPRDRFYRAARARGLPSRAAFKLEELIARFHLMRAGARVADLGCAPGGWLAVLAQAGGTRGQGVGVD